MIPTHGLLLFAAFISVALQIYSNKNIEAPIPKSAMSQEAIQNGIKLNVLVIAADALQAQRVGARLNEYSKESLTPNIDKLASAGVFFKEAYSPSSWTVPTYMSIFTSTYPSFHGLTNRYLEFNSGKKTLSHIDRTNKNITTMAEVFQDNGYSTGAFTGDSGVTAALGYNKGFDHFFESQAFGGFEQSITEYLKWLDGHAKQITFAFVHGYDNHGQFDLPEDFNTEWLTEETHVGIDKKFQAKLREQGLAGQNLQVSSEQKKTWNTWYNKKIQRTDLLIGRLINELEKRNQLKNTLVVFLSDHGTEFFEHGKVDHGHTLYNELIHVPFIISSPFKEHKQGIFNSTQISTIDLLPTLIDVLGLNVPQAVREQMQGRSLALTLEDKSIESAKVFSETEYRNFTKKRSVISTDRWKYIETYEDGSSELFNLNTDPQELNNLVSAEPKIAAKLRAELNNHSNSPQMLRTYKPNTQCLPVYKGQCE
jgi:choline-sulfatase